MRKHFLVQHRSVELARVSRRRGERGDRRLLEALFAEARASRMYMAALRRFLAEDFLYGDIARRTDLEVVKQVRALFERGLVELLLDEHPIQHALDALKRDEEEAPPIEAPPRTVKTWIEIELLDMDGNPVADERYWIKLTDGTVREGRLDAQGRAYFGELDPGECEIRWPQRDEDNCELVKRQGRGEVAGPATGPRGGQAEFSPGVHPSEKTWIEVELLDMDGNPVADERYWIKLTDGTIRQGRLDAQGRAYFANLDPGECEIRWPDRDEDACEAGDEDGAVASESLESQAQAQAMEDAAREGLPFCEECARAMAEARAA